MRNPKNKSKAKGSENEEDAVADSGSSPEPEVDGDTGNLIEDQDEFEDVVDVFENSYNFRFEDPYVSSSRPWVVTDFFRHFRSSQECGRDRPPST